MILHTLGKLTLEGSSFQRPKALLLLSYLALEGRKERRFLAELFWPGSKNARTNLAMTLMRLRQGAGEVVDANDEQAWALIEADASHFLKTFEQGSFDEALTLYQGSFLDGLPLRGLGWELEEWLLGTQEFLAAQAQLAQLELAERAARQGNFKEAAKLAAKAYDFAPETLEPERLRRLHTLCLTGGSALTTKLRAKLAAYDLPVPINFKEARALYANDSRTSEQELLHNLPGRGTSFVGRDLEQAKIARLLAEQRLVTLVGSGGVGKSRLALEIAHQQLSERQYPDGVFYIALDALGSAERLPSAIATSLALELSGPDEPLTQIVNQLNNKQPLLVLDNFEHLMAGVKVIVELLQSCPEIKLLVTSRERLQLKEEWLVEVKGLTYPKEDDLALEDAKHFDAIQLFTQRARQADAAFLLTDEMLVGIAELCHLVDGLPLALELAAVWVRGIRIFDLVRDLKRDLSILATPTLDVPDRHRSMKASFEYSWQRLSAREQTFLRGLSAFQGGFRHAAAAEVVGVTLPNLASLVHKSLLRLNSSGRYDRHPLLYQFAQEKLDDLVEERAQIRKRHGLYFLSFMEKQKNIWWQHNVSALLQTVEEELENILTAWSWAISVGKLSPLDGAVLSLMLYYEHSSRFLEGYSLFADTAAALDADNPSHHATLGTLYIAQAVLLEHLEKLTEARALNQRGLKLLETFGDRKAEARLFGLDSMIDIAEHSGNYQTAQSYAEKALELARTSGRQHWTGACLCGLGNVARELGRFDQARDYFDQALDAYRAANTAYGAMPSLNLLGELNLIQDQPKQALHHFERGFEIAQSLGHSLFICWFTLNIGKAFTGLERFPEAQTQLKLAVTLAKETFVWHLEAKALVALGKVALRIGDELTAHSYFEKSLELAWGHGVTRQLLEVLYCFAELKLKEGQTHQAGKLLNMVMNHKMTSRSVKVEVERLLGKHKDLKLTNEHKDAVSGEQAFELKAIVADLMHESASSPLL